MAQVRWNPAFWGGGRVFLTTSVFFFPAVTGSSTHACFGEKTWTRAGSLGCYGSRLGLGGGV